MSALSDELAQVRTKKKEFLAQIERIVPWKEWLVLIQPCYYKGERGNKPYPLETMLRLYLLQNLYDLSDEATAAEAIDSRAFSDFCGVDSSNQVPDGDTIGRFRNLLVKNGLQMILKKGTIVDSTIISAPSSTKNKEKKRVNAMLSSLEVGDIVVTTSGFYGEIIDITEEDVIVEFGSNRNCRIPMKKAAIAEVEKGNE